MIACASGDVEIVGLELSVITAVPDDVSAGVVPLSIVSLDVPVVLSVLIVLESLMSD